MQVMNINALGGTLPLGVFLQKDTREKSEIEIKNLGQPAEVQTSKAALFQETQSHSTVQGASSTGRTTPTWR